ncbi:hypothetical protein CBR_g12280 [Chara braunii]|uniref:Uncharacterized protein n=1 Tax=Chara braunii TaxID=69332 RepID=A0A388KRR6_CHABU|nr:hypothetical protein CBR_g12280 [Chara braunii]|eukprot:GBG72712.1 hypothetical protein CBR_g12280 [Chara braunii]
MRSKSESRMVKVNESTLRAVVCMCRPFRRRGGEFITSRSSGCVRTVVVLNEKTCLTLGVVMWGECVVLQPVSEMGHAAKSISDNVLEITRLLHVAASFVSVWACCLVLGRRPYCAAKHHLVGGI